MLLLLRKDPECAFSLASFRHSIHSAAAHLPLQRQQRSIHFGSDWRRQRDKNGRAKATVWKLSQSHHKRGYSGSQASGRSCHRPDHFFLFFSTRHSTLDTQHAHLKLRSLHWIPCLTTSAPRQAATFLFATLLASLHPSLQSHVLRIIRLGVAQYDHLSSEHPTRGSRDQERSSASTLDQQHRLSINDLGPSTTHVTLIPTALTVISTYRFISHATSIVDASELQSRATSTWQNSSVRSDRHVAGST